MKLQKISIALMSVVAAVAISTNVRAESYAQMSASSYAEQHSQSYGEQHSATYAEQHSQSYGEQHSASYAEQHASTLSGYTGWYYHPYYGYYYWSPSTGYVMQGQQANNANVNTVNDNYNSRLNDNMDQAARRAYHVKEYK